uniref:Uncharacterized protein n=1 Tax=Anguilla anguilla TaxID=7936 RepID=A0A0E9VM94_ANGAN
MFYSLISYTCKLLEFSRATDEAYILYIIIKSVYASG